MNPTLKPYLIRALHEWCSDQGHTPYIQVWVNEHTRVPMQFVKDNQIILNIGATACAGLNIDNDWVSFTARFGGVRSGIRVEPTEGPVTAERVMAATREAGFGDEVKRRIILGTHVLSAGYYDAYYGSAQKVRTLIQRDFDAVFEQVDVLVSPTAPETAFKFGEKTSDPLAMYLYDVATIPANLAGIPGVNVPNAVSSEGLPIGFQVLAPARGDLVMYKVASLVEALSDDVAGQCPAANWEEK